MKGAMEPKASDFFTKDERDRIRDAVIAAESQTSGEIRIHIENSFEGDVLDRASWIFTKIRMHKTEKRNGVLFYLAVSSRKFAVIGDSGINEVVGNDFWDSVKDLMQERFRQGRFTDGLVEAVHMAGKKLQDHFPYTRDDVNELPDEISFDTPQ